MWWGLKGEILICSVIVAENHERNMKQGQWKMLIYGKELLIIVAIH
jgi:hypothetical protein